MDILEGHAICHQTPSLQFEQFKEPWELTIGYTMLYVIGNYSRKSWEKKGNEK